MTAHVIGIDRGSGDPGNRSCLIAGQPLRITAGMLKGVKGEFVKRRLGGVILIRIDAGVYVEISELAAMAWTPLERNSP